MKRTLANLIPLSLLISAAAVASAPPEPEVLPVEEKDRFMLGVEAHFFRQSQTDLDYVVTFDEVGNSKTQFLNPGNEFSGGRVFASYMFSNENDIQLSWTHENFSDRDSISHEGISLFQPTSSFQGFYGEIGQFFGELITVDDADTISLKKELDVDVIDLDLGHVFHNESYMVRIFGGLRYAAIDDTLSIRGVGADDSDDVITIITKGHSKMHGIGPRGGFDARYRLMDHVSITGHAGAALLYGHIDSRTSATVFVDDEPFAGQALIPTAKSDKIERLVPNIDARLGLAVDFMFDEGWGIVIEGGIHADHFFNASTTVPLLSATVDANVHKTVNRDVSVYGPYVGFSILFS